MPYPYPRRAAATRVPCLTRNCQILKIYGGYKLAPSKAREAFASGRGEEGEGAARTMGGRN